MICLNVISIYLQVCAPAGAGKTNMAMISILHEASAAHELLSTLVGDVISGNDEPLMWRHVITDLVDFAVDYPPLGLLLRLPHSQGRRLVPLPAPGRAGLSPDPPYLADGGLEA
ncbi:unnamed protein product [Prunus armeniaca]|uniref:Uncharacterized protein n=1 Tax=Prunus armeniaca TaxID=36596 RepID=A0A6J5Y5Q0_PRUAR|nr:unnamed protein product [Prunus armeniaca]